MKVLLITHTPVNNFYGAGRSFSMLLDSIHNLNDIEYCVVYRNKFPFFLKNFQNKSIYNMYLPVKYNFFGASNTANLILLFFNIFFRKKAFIKLLEIEQPDIIHFNSLVLLPLFKKINKYLELKNIKIIFHIREPIKPNLSNKNRELINQINAVISIDEAASVFFYKSFGSTKNIKNFILPNIIQSRSAKLFSSKRIISSFAYIGRLDSDKGAAFICKVFLLAQIPDSKLYIFGNGLTLDAIKVYLYSISNKNIIYKGFIKNLIGSCEYQLVDVIIRGDKSFIGLGRIGIDALKDQKILILPSSELNSLGRLKELPSIYSYEARNIDSLKEVICKLAESEFSITDILAGDKHMIWTEDNKTYSDKLINIYQQVLN